jgi:exopolysaccharide biosynthesis polyprenyl glycosylphosphotransferase
LREPGPQGGRGLRLAPPIAAAEPTRAPREEIAARAWEATIASRHGGRDYWLRRALAVGDMIALTGALLVAFAASAQHQISDGVWILPVLPLWVAVFGLYGLYAQDIKRVGRGTLDDLPLLFHALLVGGLGLWAYFRLLVEPKLVLEEILLFGIAGMAFILALRSLARRIAALLFGPERVLLVGEAPVTSGLIRKMRAHPEYALQPIGLISRNGAGDAAGPSASSLPTLGSLADVDILELIQLHDFERVIVAEEEVDDELMLRLCQDCGMVQVKVSILPRGVEAMGPSMGIDDIEGVTVLGLNPLVLSRSSRMLKRSMDLAGACFGLIATAPLMAVAALAVKLTSRGPVLFRQTRIGREGEEFTLYKLRTMVHDAESRTADLMAVSEDPHWLKLDDDPRVTRTGRLLRLCSVDELPQLWSVLAGKMSLVGPRPLTPADYAQIAGWGGIRLDLAPGITGLWQVLGRTSIPFEEMIKLDYVYVTNWSLWLDIKLLVKTIPAVLLRRGAN